MCNSLPLGPIFFMFLQFLGKFGTIIGWHPQFRVAAPNGKCWICAKGSITSPVTDPGWTQGGQLGCQLISWSNFAKTCMEVKKNGTGGGRFEKFNRCRSATANIWQYVKYSNIIYINYFIYMNPFCPRPLPHINIFTYIQYQYISTS